MNLCPEQTFLIEVVCTDGAYVGSCACVWREYEGLACHEGRV